VRGQKEVGTGLCLLRSTVLTVRLLIDAVELQVREGCTTSSAAEALLVVALAKNGKEALVKSLATAIANSAKGTLVAI